MKDFLAMFVPAETALLGAATGFYFASQAAAETAEAVAAADRVRSSGPGTDPADLGRPHAQPVGW